MNNYEEKQQRKLERYQELQAKHEREAKARFNTAREIGSYIPFGQPILVGHHSEKRHRRDLDKIDNNMRKSIEHKKTAEYYANKVDNIENPRAISSDDPEAIAKLKEKLARIEKEIEKIKEHNKKCKKFVKLALFRFRPGYIEIADENNLDGKSYAVVVDGQLRWERKRVNKEIKKIIEDYFKTGKLEQPEIPKENKKLPAWHLQNLHQNKTRIKDRIAHLEALHKVEEIDVTKNKVRLYISKEDNRVRLEFPGKPSEEVRTNLKRNGFRWSPYNMAWQKQISQYAIDQAKEIQENYHEG